MIDYASVQGFFDDYPRFHEKSQTGSDKIRLSTRYRALIEANAPLIKGKRVLDLASHDGRWSLAALKAGAEHVLGIEARPELGRHRRLSGRRADHPDREEPIPAQRGV